MFNLEFKINLIIFINIMLIFYILYNKNIEKFAVTDDIKAEINKVYQADVDAIRNLSAIASKLQAGGVTVPGNLTVSSDIIANAQLYCTGWLRSKGQNGLYFQDYGGGWHMVDGTWIRAYNGKNVYCAAEMRANRMSTEANITCEGNLYCNNWLRTRGQNGLYFEDYGGGWHMTDNDWIRAYNGKSVYCAAKTLTEKLQVQQETVLNGATTVTGDLVVNGKIKLGNFYIYPGTANNGDYQLYIGNLDKSRGIRISMGNAGCDRLAWAGRDTGLGGNYFDC